MDNELLKRMPGAQALHDWYGWFPGFHDANAKMELNQEGECTLTIQGHQMTSRVDPNGFFELTKHFTAVLLISGITTASFSDFMPGWAILDGLQFSYAEEEGFRLEIYSTYGMTGFIIAQHMALRFEPRDTTSAEHEPR